MTILNYFSKFYFAYLACGILHFINLSAFPGYSVHITIGHKPDLLITSNCCPVNSGNKSFLFSLTYLCRQF